MNSTTYVLLAVVAFAVFVYGNVRVLRRGTIPKASAVYGYALYWAVAVVVVSYPFWQNGDVPIWAVAIVAAIAFGLGYVVFSRTLRVVPPER